MMWNCVLNSSRIDSYSLFSYPTYSIQWMHRGFRPSLMINEEVVIWFAQGTLLMRSTRRFTSFSTEHINIHVHSKRSRTQPSCSHADEQSPSNSVNLIFHFNRFNPVHTKLTRFILIHSLSTLIFLCFHFNLYFHFYSSVIIIHFSFINNVTEIINIFLFPLVLLLFFLIILFH